METNGIGRVNRMYQSIPVYREIQQQRCIMSHTAIIEINQLFGSLYKAVLFGMIEPTRTDGDIAFGCHPLVAICMTILKLVTLVVTGIYFTLTEERPVGGTGKTLFVAHPPATGTAVGEDDCLRLYTVQHLVNARIIVVITTVDGTRLLSSAIPSVSTIGSIEPNFEHFTIIGQQITQLSIKIVQIRRRSVIGLMTIPGRQINSKLQSIFLASFRQFAHDVSFTIFIRTVCHTVVGAGKRPKAKSIVMLGRKNDTFHSCCHQSLGPLFAIQTRRIEHLRRCVTISPFTVVERIQTKVDKSIGFHLLPFHLLRLRNRKNRIGSLDMRGRTRRHHN